MTEYLTTKELAALLRIKERKVYDLAATGQVPCSKAMGKLLFPRAAVESWLAGRGTGLDAGPSPQLANVFFGSHDPLLEWALRESRSGLATYFDGSLDGLRRFAAKEGVAAGMHLFDAASDTWNIAHVEDTCATHPAVLVGWCRRQRGLILRPELQGRVRRLEDIAGLRLVPRQAEAGAQLLLEHLLKKAGLDAAVLDSTAPARSESDAVLAIAEAKGDVTIGLEAYAAQFRLPFVPLAEEQFDLLIDRRSWFEPPLQRFLTFCSGSVFRSRAAELAGYDVSGFGTVYRNGP